MKNKLIFGIALGVMVVAGLFITYTPDFPAGCAGQMCIVQN